MNQRPNLEAGSLGILRVLPAMATAHALAIPVGDGGVAYRPEQRQRVLFEKRLPVNVSWES